MATVAQINTAWDEAAALTPILPISSLSDSTPLTQVVTQGGQSALNAQLERVKEKLLASADPDIDLDTANVGSVRTATEFVDAPG